MQGIIENQSPPRGHSCDIFRKECENPDHLNTYSDLFC